MSAWTLGQKVIVVEPGHREARITEAEITKIGRKWVTVGTGWQQQRFGFDGRGESDHGHRARIYADLATYEASAARNRAWNDLKALMNRTYGLPDHLTTEQILAMAATLRGKPDVGSPNPRDTQ